MTAVHDDPGAGVEQETDLAGSVETSEMLRQTNAGYRQVFTDGRPFPADPVPYWVRQGWLQPLYPASGSGVRRRWPAAEVAIVRRMVQLVRVGMHPRTAAHCARNGYTTWLSDSVRVTVSPLTVRILPGWEDGDGP